MCGYGALIHDSADTAIIKPTGCRSWTCEICAPLRKARCEIIARRGRPTKFLTLTAWNRFGTSPEDRRQRMGAAFPLLIRRMQRYLGEKVEYFVTVEKTKWGEPHLHVLLRCGYIPQRLISNWWKELTGAFIVHIRKVDDKKNAARYVSKYLNKALEKIGNSKRYWMSRGWELPPEETEEVAEYRVRSWRHSKEDIDDLIFARRLLGWYCIPGESKRGEVTMWSPGRYRNAFSYLDRWREG